MEFVAQQQEGADEAAEVIPPPVQSCAAADAPQKSSALVAAKDCENCGVASSWISSTPSSPRRCRADEAVKVVGEDPLPLPCGKPNYLGFIEHENFGGRLRVRLSVTQVEGLWHGVWELGGPQGLREMVQVQLLGDMRVSISTVSGRETTLLHGEAGSNGVLRGEVVHEDTGGGIFKLWPTEQQRFAKRLQEWYVALRSGPCVELVPHKPGAPLPAECSVCLEKFGRGDVIVRTCCSEEGHVFHRGCLYNWLQSSRSCPLCRRTLVPTADQWEAVVMVDDVYEMSSYLSYNMWRATQP